jgi:glutamate formiminotransferase
MEKSDSGVVVASVALPIVVHDVVQIMANMINYLSVSLYESAFTKNHEDAYYVLRSIYDSVALRPSVLPSLQDIKQFYENIVYLGSVTYTEDPDYYTYKRGLRKYIIT